MAPPDFTPNTSFSGSGPDSSPAGYGRSCTNCSRAKCKCIIRGSNTSCERCARLGKPCQPIATARRRVEKKSTPSRTAQLEEKLDDLVSILRSSQGQMHQTRPAYAPPQAPDTPVFTPTSRLDGLATAATASDLHSGHQGALNLNANFNESHELPEPTPAEAELYLKKFRGWLKHFPFMILDPNISAAELRKERPFLWLCIMNICSMSVPQMREMKQRIRQELAESLVIKHEPSMDILLGLLAYLGWATMNSGPGWTPFLVLFSQMAMSVTFELGLNRSPVEEEYFAKCFRAWGGRQPQAKSRTSEERRALLSLWYLTSLTTCFIGKIDRMRWTLHMEESLEILEREKQGQDGILCSLVRMQLIGDEAHKLLVQDIMRGEQPGHTPSHVYRKSMLNRLQEARGRMTQMASSSYVVQAHSHSTEVLIHSMGLFTTKIPETQRVDSLYTCLRSVRDWYDIWFSVPLPEMPSLPFSMFIQLSQTQVALYRLTIAEDPAWDKEFLRNTADLLVILDRTIERFEAMATAYPLTPGSEDIDATIFSKATKIMKNIKASWEPALAQNLGGQGLPTPNSYGSSAAAAGLQIGQPGQIPLGPGGTVLDNTDPNLGGPPITMDFTDLAWMTDVFGPWEF